MVDETMELLNYAKETGIINLNEVRDKANAMKYNEAIARHQYDIWEGNNKKWYTYLPDDNARHKRKLVKRSTEKGLKDVIVRYYSEQKEVITFPSYFINWIARQKEFGLSNSTITKYESDYKRFFEVDNILLNKNLNTFTEQDIENFLFRTFGRKKITYKTLVQMFYILSGVFKLAIRNKVINENPCQLIELMKYKRRCVDRKAAREKRVLDKEGCKNLIRILEEDRINKRNYIPSYAVELTLLTGFRAGELAFLKWSHINYKEKYILICGSEKYDQKTKIYYDDTTKTEKERRFPLTEELIGFFDNLKKVEMEFGYLGEFVFSNEYGRIHRGTLTSCGRNKCLQANLPAKGLQVLRRTFNSLLKDDGISTSIASSILGHTDEVNDKNYTYDISNMEDKIKAVEKINKITKVSNL